jgi:phospholipid-binding lipoprotein MlaA
LPLLGPSTIRDTVALPGDFWGDPWTHVNDIPWRNGGIVLRAVDQRASVLDASNLLEDAALDRYEFIRDGYLQRRSSKVLDTDKAEVRAEKVQEKIDKVQDQVREKLGVKKAETPGEDEGAAPAAPPSEPAPAPVSSEPVRK